MKHFKLILIALTACWGCSSEKKTESNTDSTAVVVPNVILDTDIGPDYDDVGAVAILHALADSGKVNPLAIIASNAHPLVVPTIDILNTYFGRPELQTGVPKSKNAPRSAATQGWPELLVSKYPHKIKASSDAPDALGVYRKLLASQPDSSVTIVTVGFLTNMANLLDSKPDSLSQLSGKELISKKVKRLVSMAGLYPEGREFNVYIDSLGAEKVFTQWPTEIIFSGFEIGQEIRTGARLIKSNVQNSPVKDAFAKAMSFSKEDSLGRQSWDQTAILVGALGTEPFFGLQRGHYVSKGGNNAWKNDPNGPHAYLKFKMPQSELTKVIEDLMMHTRK